MKTRGLTTFIHQWVQQLWLTRQPISWLLMPLTLLVEVILAIRRWYYTRWYRAVFSTAKPIVVVGNLYAGGTGKTPATIGIVKLLQQKGWTPGVISRGYGARSTAHPRCGEGQLDASDFGDEPALIARLTDVPVCIFPKREVAALKLLTSYPQVDVLICDDGLQHLALARDLEIIVQDQRGTGNGWVQPAGPLREGVHRLGAADVIITNHRNAVARGTNNDTSSQVVSPTNHARQVAMYQDVLGMRHLASGELLTLMQFLDRCEKKHIGAAAAIGEPTQFFQGLRELGISLTQTQAASDHLALDAELLASFECDVVLITAKDAIKCDRQLDDRLWVVDVETRFDDLTFVDWLNDKLFQIQQDKKRLGLQ